LRPSALAFFSDGIFCEEEEKEQKKRREKEEDFL
jgi:hypothetical protein